MVIFFVISCKILVLGWKMLKTKNQGSILCILNVDNLNITCCVTLDREWRVVGWCWKTWMPWFFWCYPFEKEVSKLVNISSNQLMSESFALIIMLNYVSQQFTRECTSRPLWTIHRSKNIERCASIFLAPNWCVSCYGQ